VKKKNERKERNVLRERRRKTKKKGRENEERESGREKSVLDNVVSLSTQNGM
jgi:hypothetical protein